MYKFAVFGNPVRHSLSPSIHRLFAQQFGIDVAYDAVECTAENFSVTIEDFFRYGGNGANVTLPFKQLAFSLAATVSPAAQLAVAANTLFLKEKKIHADNTDGVGLVKDLTLHHGVDLEHSHLLLLGAGGAVRGVLGPLLEATTHAITVVNRTREKAQQLARHFSALGQITVYGYPDLVGRDYDVMINGTSASLAGTLPALPKALTCHNTLAYDMMYGNKPTVFMQWAQQHGAEVVCDGLGMLLEQAAESFFLWTGLRPATAPVRTHLLQQRSLPAH